MPAPLSAYLRTGAVNVRRQSERMEAAVSSVASAEVAGRHVNGDPGLEDREVVVQTSISFMFPFMPQGR